MKPTITMIDYGASNIRSAQKAFEHVGAAVHLTADPADVHGAAKLVLPGVGAFGAGMRALRERGLDTAVRETVARGVPLLGICLGMQFLFDNSDEMGEHEGLGLIPGRVTRFPEELSMANGQLSMVNDDDEAPFRTPNSAFRILKVPHMGWNQIEHNGRHPLLAGVPSGRHVYFVHSYYCIPQNEGDVVATTDYGIEFTAIAARDNIYGIQFHPEKSQKIGLRIIKNFVEMEA